MSDNLQTALTIDDSPFTTGLQYYNPHSNEVKFARLTAGKLLCLSCIATIELPLLRSVHRSVFKASVVDPDLIGRNPDEYRGTLVLHNVY